MAEIVFSPKAGEDLDGIKEYIETELKSPVAANNRVLEILDAIGELARFPRLGPSLQEKISSLAQYRYLTVAGNIVFYRIEKEKVMIVRILGARTDYIKTLELGFTSRTSR
jgi:plasmid stabilization system protein ParE